MEIKRQADLEYEEELQAIAGLRLLDDDLMTLVFDRNIEAAELLLNVILQRNDLKVAEVVAQREYKNPMAGGRSIKIDIYAVDSEENIGKLMHDFRCINSADMFYTVLAEQVRYFKETEEGRKIMSETFEELANRVAESRAKVMAKAMAETMAQTMAETMAESMVETKTKEEKKSLHAVCWQGEN